MMLEEMDRSIHDSLMAVKRVLESKEVREPSSYLFFSFFFSDIRIY